MKPIDLQVNILKSLDMVSEKARESLLHNQIANMEEKSKKERESRDFHVPDNREPDEVKNKLPDKLHKRKGSGEKEQFQKDEDEDLEQEGKEQSESGKTQEKDEEQNIGNNLDIVG